MILVFERLYPGSRNSRRALLCKIETEDEAFAEMRRFLEVNNIKSDSTTIYKKNWGYDFLDRSKTTVIKEIKMCKHFAIVYDEGMSDALHIEDLQNAQINPDNYCYEEENIPRATEELKQVKTYLEDYKARKIDRLKLILTEALGKAGNEECL